MLVFVKDDYTSEIRPGAGIRQRCGLAPLLSAPLTVLVFTKLEQYLLPGQITMYADDYHIAWEIQSSLQFKNACLQSSSLDDLAAFGMMVSYEKTVIIMSFGGTQAPHHPAQHEAAKGRQSSLHTHQTRPNQPPHTQGACLLGCQIGYGHYERSTVLYRTQQAWQSFHRLHRVLISRALPVRTRFQLWDACIHSVLFYGLSTITLDTQGAHAIRTQVTKQLRMVARSPAHINHESHQQFYGKHKLPDPVEQLLTATTKRLQSAQQYLSRLQPAITLLRWKQLLGQEPSCDAHPRWQIPS